MKAPESNWKPYAPSQKKRDLAINEKKKTKGKEKAVSEWNCQGTFAFLFLHIFPFRSGSEWIQTFTWFIAIYGKWELMGHSLTCTCANDHKGNLQDCVTGLLEDKKYLPKYIVAFLVSPEFTQYLYPISSCLLAYYLGN